MPSSPDLEYFRLSSHLAAPFVTDWRVVRVAPGIIRLTLYERSVEVSEQILSPRGAFTTSLEAFTIFVEFANKLLAHWREEAEGGAPRPTHESPSERPN